MSRSPVRDHFYELAALETDECVIWPHAKTNGYGVLNLDDRTVKTHRLALVDRVGDRPGMDAAHGACHNRSCMNYRHLRWATRTENLADKKRDGTHLHGENVTISKLTEGAVRLIRESSATNAELGQRFGVSLAAVSKVRNRKSWRHVA